MLYTPNQQKAIETIDSNLQIIACAGSGKTQVISARIVEILSQGAEPGEVVAFTFTEKAAGELQDRIDRLCRERLGTNQGLGEMYVGTIHGYCLNLLQAPPLYRFLKYTVLNEVQQRLLIDRYSTQSGLTTTPLINGGTLSRWLDSRLYQDLLGILTEGDVDWAQIHPEVRASYDAYNALLHEKRQLDFSTIIAEAVRELENNELLRELIAGQVKYLVVDEYQDVNPLQERLISLIHQLGANVCVVGDDDQTIYQWRGSEVNNIVGFADRYPSVEQIRLNENFRSSVGVVETARTVVERNPDRLPKHMISTDAQPFEYGDVLALEFESVEDEAEWIVERIRWLYGSEYRDRPGDESRGLSYSDFAVLFRSVRNDAGPLKEALETANIPYVISGMNELFETREVQAMQIVFEYLGDFAPRGQTPPSIEIVREALGAAALGLTPQQIANGLNVLESRKELIGNVMDVRLYLERLYLDFLDALEIREETVPSAGGRTGEIVFYNLGKFSQVITDYEQINFNSAPNQLFNQFASFLHYQAHSYYPEGWEEAGFAEIDAVQILTVHKAKGMQWPAVFVPALRKNRFPSRRQGGRSVWHVIPETAVANADRYRGTVEDERRLFYVAITRAERYLHCTYAPIPDNQQQRRISPFMREMSASGHVLTADLPFLQPLPQAEPRPRREENVVVLSFSELKYYFECPYSFKLRFLYGFTEPVSRALGFGRSLHNILAEVHAESMHGRIPTHENIPDLIERHLYLPFANKEVQENLEQATYAAISGYLDRHSEDLALIEHVEKPIELKLAEGIVVNGRVDLIRRTKTDDWVIVDFKSNERVQAEDITLRQLQVYALGYEQLTGKRAKLIEVHNLDDGGIDRSVVHQQLIDQTVDETIQAGHAIRDNDMPRIEIWCSTCDTCRFAGICRTEV